MWTVTYTTVSATGWLAALSFPDAILAYGEPVQFGPHS